MTARRYRRANDFEKLIAYGSLAVAAAGIAILIQLTLAAKPRPDKPAVTVYAAVSLQPALDAAAAAYTKDYGTPIKLVYGASGELEGKLRLHRDQAQTRADLYLPADATFANRARTAGLITDAFQIATMRLILGISPHVDAAPDSLDALLASGLPYAVCDPTAGAGAATAAALGDRFPEVQAAAKTTFPRVTEAAAPVAIAMGVQAAFVWDVTARQFNLRVVTLPELAAATSTVTANLVTDAPQPEAARKFAQFLASPAATNYFRDHGFSKQ